MKKLVSIFLFLWCGAWCVKGQTILKGTSPEGQKLYKALVTEDEAALQKIQALNRTLTQYKKEKNKTLIEKTEEKIQQAELNRRKLYEKTIHENKDSALSVYAMGLYGMINYANPVEVEKLLNTMSPQIQRNEQFVELREVIEREKKLMIGQPAPVFSQADTAGNQLSLESFKGKYVLIDFWASWCKPCRAQNPQLVKIYEKNKNKNFTILGISLDSKKENWIKAIHDDKLPWYHVSDLKLWNNAVAKLYGIYAVPQTYLIDPNGIIIAKNLREEKLEQMIERSVTSLNYPEMIKVEGGTFTMGDTKGIGQDNEKPLHEVTLNNFSIAKTETTISQWRAYCNATGRNVPDSVTQKKDDNHPVVNIKWDEAIGYTKWLSEVTGKSYRLPTEAEWEYAAKGGKLTGESSFSGSSDIDSVAWYQGNSNRETHAVAQKKPNELGLYDMTGNVWEWCLDLYEEYTAAAVNNPRGATTGDKIIFRGGGWFEPAQYSQMTLRGQTDDRNYHYHDLGFRVVLEE